MVYVSLDGLFAPILDAGLDESAWAQIEPELQNARDELVARRDEDMGFLNLPKRVEWLKSINAEAARLRALADDLLVLGVGGSSEGGQALTGALSSTSDRPVRVHFVDNVDADALADLLDSLEPARTAVAVITKSGDTPETMAQLLVLRRWLRVTLGQGEMRSRMTFVTDPETGLLREIAKTEGIRAFEIPTNVSGRFSALTPVGLLPGAFLGIDIAKVVSGAESMLELVTTAEVDQNPACKLAGGMLMARRKLGRKVLLMMPYADALKTTSHWFVQMWTEALTRGASSNEQQLPIVSVGASDQHAQLRVLLDDPRDKALLLLTVARGRRSLPIPDELADREELGYLRGRDLAELFAAERRATRAAALEAGVPVLEVGLPVVDEASFGALVMLLESGCACMGLALGIDPFARTGKPDTGKRMTLGLLGHAGYHNEARDVLRRESPSEKAGGA